MTKESKVALSVTIFVAVGVALQWLGEKRRKVHKMRTISGDSKADGYVTPPLPTDVVRLLKASRLCPLGTQSESGEPHLSLMNFTYYQEDEVVIFGTSRTTSKVHSKFSQ